MFRVEEENLENNLECNQMDNSKTDTEAISIEKVKLNLLQYSDDFNWFYLLNCKIKTTEMLWD